MTSHHPEDQDPTTTPIPTPENPVSPHPGYESGSGAAGGVTATGRAPQGSGSGFDPDTAGSPGAAPTPGTDGASPAAGPGTPPPPAPGATIAGTSGAVPAAPRTPPQTGPGTGQHVSQGSGPLPGGSPESGPTAAAGGSAQVDPPPPAPAGAGTGAGSHGTADVAKDQARNVADESKTAAHETAQTARDEARNVAHEAKDQARNLADTVGSELRDQAGTQQQRVAEGLRGVADELQAMLRGEGSGQGAASSLVQQAADRAGSAASWLENRDPGTMLEDVRHFARRRPGTFLAIAAGAGLLAGRLTRNLAQDPNERKQDQASGTDTAGMPRDPGRTPDLPPRTAAGTGAAGGVGGTDSGYTGTTGSGGVGGTASGLRGTEGAGAVGGTSGAAGAVPTSDPYGSEPTIAPGTPPRRDAGREGFTTP